jgi:hypothetical protein
LPCVRYHYNYVLDADNNLIREVNPFHKQNQKYSHYYNDDNYMRHGKTSEKAIVVVHGLCDFPETWNYCFLKLQEMYPNHAIFVVSLPHNAGELNLQSLYVDADKKSIISDLHAIQSKYNKCIVMAHSLGGALMTHIALDGVLRKNDQLILLGPCFGSIASEMSWSSLLIRGWEFYFESLISKYCDSIESCCNIIVPIYSYIDPDLNEQIEAFGGHTARVKLARSVAFDSINKSMSDGASAYNTFSRVIASNSANIAPLLCNICLVHLTQDAAVPAKPIKHIAGLLDKVMNRNNSLITVESSHCGFLYNTDTMDSLLHSLRIIMR